MDRTGASRSSSLRWMVAVLLVAGASLAHERDGRWHSAWTVSHGARQVPAGVTLSGSSFRMIVRPTISGEEVRVKLENTMGQAPVTFSAAYIGVLDAGAALVPRSNRQLTFGGSSSVTIAPGPGLTNGPDTGVYSDPVHFKVKAFQRLAVSLEVASASDVSAHALGLVTNYVAPGGHAAGTSGDGFVAIPDNGGNFPFYWVASIDVKAEATGTI